MKELRPIEVVNPVKSLRDWRDQMSPARRAESEAAQAAFSSLSVASLREINDRLIWQPISPNAPELIVQLWLANLELTQRGIGPRWRNLPTYVAPEAAPNVPEFALPPNAPMPISYASRKRALLRWIDLDWLCHTLGAAHFPEHPHWRDIFRWGLNERIAERIANSSLKPARLSSSLDIPTPHCYALTGLLTQDSAKRIRMVREKRIAKARNLFADRPGLGAALVAERLIWVEALELAEGSPTESALIYSWMTGAKVTKQSAAEKRKKFAQQLGFQTATWRPK